MTEKDKKKKDLIPDPIKDALYMSAGSVLLCLVLGADLENAIRYGLSPGAVSLIMTGSRSFKVGMLAGKRKRIRHVPFTNHEGTKRIQLEYALPFFKRTITRETVKPVSRPVELDDFIFNVYYQDQLIQLRERHVKLFLRSAWRNRAYGKGLSERRWVRNRSQRPAWYKELSELWYYGMSMLLWQAQKELKQQLVIQTGHQWYALAVEPHTLMSLLKWYEHELR